MNMSGESENFKRGWCFSRFGPLGLRAQLTKQPPQSSSKGIFFVRVWFEELPSTVAVAEVVRDGSVAWRYLVERPTQETRAEQYSDTVLLLSGKSAPQISRSSCKIKSSSFPAGRAPGGTFQKIGEQRFKARKILSEKSPHP